MNWPALWLVSTFFLMLVVIVEAHRWYDDDPRRPYLWLAGRVGGLATATRRVLVWLPVWRDRLEDTAGRL